MKTKNNNNKNDFAGILRKAGFRATPTRISVLSTLSASKKPLSPQGVIDAIGKQADQATVYRILRALKEAGVTRQVDFRHNHPHYELTNVKDHHHLICTRCGHSEELQGCDVEVMQKAALRQAKRFTAIEDHSLEFYGVCKSCASSS